MNRIIYLHGFASGPQSNKARFFRQYLQRAGFRVDVPDLAAGDFEHLTISRQLSVVDRTAADEPVSLIGSSLGGYLAALFAARHPGVTRVVLLAPAFAFAKGWTQSLGPAKLEAWRKAGSIEVFHYGEGRERRLSYHLLEDARQYEDYPKMRQPALIFHGALDDTVPPRRSEEFAAAHANARLEILDSGHELLNVLDYMAPKVTAFLQQG